jgi:hypothetical protein
MKPTSPQIHEDLAKWVEEGGVLVFVGRDDDPYQTVQEWWNTKGNSYKTPAQHLFEVLKIKPSASSEKFDVGNGVVYLLRQNPKEFVLNSNADSDYLQLIQKAYKAAGEEDLELKNNLYLERGAYEIVSVIDESVTDKPYVIDGPVIDLFNPELPVLAEKIIEPGHQGFLYSLDKVIDKMNPQVLASASRIYEEVREGKSYSFLCKSPSNTINSMRILLPNKPKEISLTNNKGQVISAIKLSWDTSSNTQYLKFENDPDGINVNINW